VAGPIERAVHLLPQFYVKRSFDKTKAVDGLRQILWGLFKKIVIADNCATYANLIFNNSGDYSGSTLVLGALFFTFQIYGDSVLISCGTPTSRTSPGILLNSGDVGTSHFLHGSGTICISHSVVAEGVLG